MDNEVNDILPFKARKSVVENPLIKEKERLGKEFRRGDIVLYKGNKGHIINILSESLTVKVGEQLIIDKKGEFDHLGDGRYL